ncbi:MAG: glycine/betaine/sarcosine/D-proline family reductase selenoprotein B, partial [Clostridia bacterium]|nr:glycine/betaine/sarcosine/D-proline family reductase selenoprotein B [Clostridia bacterium]
MDKKRIVHYINQFFAGIGGEEKAGNPPEKRDGAVGPGMALQAALSGEAVITDTVICGDGYFNENLEEASRAVLGMIRDSAPDMVIAGPAFNAGRYGMACGAVAKLVQEELGIPVVGGMYPENPGIDSYKRYGYFISTGDSAASMRKAVPEMAALLKKLAAGAEVTEGFIPKGLRVNLFAKERGSKRAVDMLIKKINGEPFDTEYPMPVFDRVLPQPAIRDMTKARIALVSSGGPVPKGNPDRIESSSASKYGKYSLRDIGDLTPENGETAHGGYDPVYANLDLDRVLPVDVIKEMLACGEI